VDFLLDLFQALGVGAAIGIRPALPVLLVGVLASANLGVDFDGTDFAFIEQAPFLLGMLVLVAVSDILRRRQGHEFADHGPGLVVFALVALGLAGLVGAATMADRAHPIAPGITAGVLAAALGFLTARSLFMRVRRRLDAESAGALPVYAEASALGAAGLSVLFPPLAILIVVALAWLLGGGRRREGEKHAGLRVLR
jgi:hypothetical protein